MIGKRVEPVLYESGGMQTPKPGEYLKIDGYFIGCTPNGQLANLSAHQVTEHDDGTITVSPSILVSDNTGPLWHGYLERGVWREC
jgi:hypothetical protein